MEQNDINQQLFARLTVQNMLLEQLYIAFFFGMDDKGARFMDEFLRSLRYKLSVPADAHQESGVDAMQLQADALCLAERFFSSVQSRVSNS